MAGPSYHPRYRTSGQEDLASRFSQVSLSGSPLVDLPLDIFLMIWDQLPNYSRVCLILTCHAFYDTNKHVLSSVGKESPECLEQRLFLLRRLRKDIPQFPFICRRCLQLYKDHPLKSKELQYPECIRGTEVFAQKYPPVHPSCDSGFTRALQDLRSQFFHHNRAIFPLNFYGRGGRHNALHYHSTMTPECVHHLFQEGSRIMSNPGRHRFQELTNISMEVPVSKDESDPLTMLAEVLKSVRTFNIDFCTHLWLGEDFTPGDSSVSDKLEVKARSLAEDWAIRPETPKYEGFTILCDTGLSITCEHCPVKIEFRAVSSGEATFLIQRDHDLRRLNGTQWPL